MNLRIALAALSMLALAACSSSTSTPADLTGTYTGNVVNGATTCPGNWKVGDTAQITATVTESGSNATFDVTGPAGVYLGVVIGAHTFNGTVSGASFDGKLTGTIPQTLGTCTYVIQAELSGSLSGNTFEGAVVYTPSPTGGNCGAAGVAACSSKQAINAVRPPK